jgi:hypothetical protein
LNNPLETLEYWDVLTSSIESELVKSNHVFVAPLVKLNCQPLCNRLCHPKYPTHWNDANISETGHLLLSNKFVKSKSRSNVTLYVYEL